MVRNNISEHNTQQLPRYIGGLRQDIHVVLSLHVIWSVSEPYQRVLVVEKQQIKSGIQDGGLLGSKVRVTPLRKYEVKSDQTRQKPSRCKIHVLVPLVIQIQPLQIIQMLRFKQLNTLR